jgi:hypothetical protein
MKKPYLLRYQCLGYEETFYVLIYSETAEGAINWFGENCDSKVMRNTIFSVTVL